MKKFNIIIILFIIQLIYPKIQMAQSPNLASTADFAIFTATGAIDVLGTSKVWGDVGTNVGAFTISAPSVISGNINNTNSISAQAATDVAILYGDLVSLTCGQAIPGAARLGNQRKVLFADTIYCLGGAQTLTGNVTLDAQSDPSAIFIIQIDGAFSTSTSSTITLINSASYCNVFWQVNGAVNLGVSSIFYGNIVANGAISLLDGAILNGRALSQAGAISLYNNIVTGCDAYGNPLAVVLIDFSVVRKLTSAELNWSTASEINNDKFTVQRSSDGQVTEDLFSVNGHGSSLIGHKYSAIDYHPIEGISYYRLKQTDFSGKIDYSGFISLNYVNSSNISIYPNPVINSAIISVPSI